MPITLQHGDLIEVPLSQGFGYAQYIHDWHVDGSTVPLTRIIEGQYEYRPTDLEELAAMGDQFLDLWLIQFYLDEGDIQYIGSAKIPERHKEFPVFRSGMRMPDRRIKLWFIGDGDNLTKVTSLTEEQLEYPLKGISPIEFVVKRIESGWRHSYVRGEPDDAYT